MRFYSPLLLSILSECLSASPNARSSVGGHSIVDGERVPLVMYIDGGSGASDQAIEAELLGMADAGVSTIILAFYMIDMPDAYANLYDISLRWSQVPKDTRSGIVEKLHARNSKLLLSAGGAAQHNYWENHNPNEYGTTLCLRAKYLQFDGVDFDLEDVSPVNAPTITEWLHQSAKSCREVFPEAILTSAPQSPYLVPGWGRGPCGNGFWDDMLKLGAKDGAVHNHMYIQYYNQGAYYQANSYEELFSGDKAYTISTLMKTYPDVPKDTFFVGKNWIPADGTDTDWVDPATLRAYVCKARAQFGWQGGLMFWQHHWGDQAALETYRMLSAPCELGSTTTTILPSTTIKSSTPKFLSTSQSKSGATERTTALPDSTRSTTTGAASDVIKGCKAGISAVAPQFVTACQGHCDTYGPGGVLEVECKSSESSASDLINCVVKHVSYCRARNAPSTSTNTAITTTLLTTRATSESTKSNSMKSTSTGMTASTQKPSGIVAGCKAAIKATQPQWAERCRDLCPLYGPGGDLAPYCDGLEDTVAHLIECIHNQAPYCVEKN